MAFKIDGLYRVQDVFNIISVILQQPVHLSLLFRNSFYTYGISPNKCLQSDAKHRKEAFILYPICKAKSLS